MNNEQKAALDAAIAVGYINPAEFATQYHDEFSDLKSGKPKLSLSDNDLWEANRAYSASPVKPIGAIESDPNGKPAREPGAKLDSGKNRLGLVLLDFSRALQAVGEVGTFGANKYSPSGWVSVPDGSARYTDALLRHLFKDAEGERCDTDSGLLHAAHAAWNALARLDLELRRNDRQPS